MITGKRLIKFKKEFISYNDYLYSIWLLDSYKNSYNEVHFYAYNSVSFRRVKTFNIFLNLFFLYISCLSNVCRYMDAMTALEAKWFLILIYKGYFL